VSRPVGIGTAVVACIEPSAGQARAFNRWYEDDHFPAAVMAGPGAFAGARWVATRACKAVRPPGTLFGDPRQGSYLATAWVIDGMQADWDAWVLEQMQRLVADDRMFAGRRHVHTAVYREQCTVGPGQHALDYGYPGVTAIAAEVAPAEAELWARALVGPEVPAAVVLTQERVVLSVAEPGDHVLVLAFCAGDVLATWRERIEPAFAELAAVGFASPFVRTVPGTDTYADEI
jgi:hypothetical protein